MNLNNGKHDTKYQVCKKIRAALASDLFPTGIYTPDQMRAMIIQAGVTDALCLFQNTVSDQARVTSCWSHNGVKASGSRWTKLPPPAPAPVALPPAPLAFDAEYAPADHADLAPWVLAIARIESKLDQLLAQLT